MNLTELTQAAAALADQLEEMARASSETTRMLKKIEQKLTDAIISNQNHAAARSKFSDGRCVVPV